MATKRKRLNVTMSDEVWALVNEVHGFTGASKSSIVSEILDEIAPVFVTQIQALKLLSESPREAQRLMQNFANESIGKVAQSQLALDAALDARTMKGKRAKTGGISGRAP
jgi:hypothetical protein